MNQLKACTLPARGGTKSSFFFFHIYGWFGSSLRRDLQNKATSNKYFFVLSGGSEKTILRDNKGNVLHGTFTW